MPNFNKDKYIVFEEEVKKHFHFLEKDYGFRLSQVKQVGLSKIIRFESKQVYLNLAYGPPAYEVEMSFGRIGIDDLPNAYSFEPGDLILLNACSQWKWKSEYPDHLTGLISEFARLLRECSSACLKGEQAVFEEMKKKRDLAIKQWHQDEATAAVRKKAEAAWSQKDYVQVVNLYKSIEPMLSLSEKKKLNFARKHIKA